MSQGPIPIVVLNRYIPKIASKCFSLNNELGGYLATKATIEKGHREIVYISGPAHKADALQRLVGHKRALAEAGIRLDESRLFMGDYLQLGGQQGYEHFIQKGVSFTAVICGNDEMATGVMAAARDAGLTLPEDLSIMGFDDVIFSRYTFPRLSTIENPIARMGEMAATTVMQEVYKKPGGPIKNLFEPKLISRESVVNIVCD